MPPADTPEAGTPRSDDSFEAPWPWILGLIGVDYFSTLAYQPSLAFEAAGPLAPLATLPLVGITLVADRFGQRNVGIVYGWVFAAHMVGAAIASWVAGIVRDSVGDYAAAFVAAGWIAILAGFAAMFIGRPGRSASPTVPTEPATA